MSPALPRLTARIVSAYVARHRLALVEVVHMIGVVGATLQALAPPGAAAPSLPLTPAVPIQRSIQREYLVCLEDGRKRKLLKRYLRTVFDLSPAQYRAKWGLPDDYPMVAPAYASTRSRLARLWGLGRSAGQRLRVVPAAPAAPS